MEHVDPSAGERRDWAFDLFRAAFPDDDPEDRSAEHDSVGSLDERDAGSGRDEPTPLARHGDATDPSAENDDVRAHDELPRVCFR
jgi:hypothetical protein